MAIISLKNYTPPSSKLKAFINGSLLALDRKFFLILMMFFITGILIAVRYNTQFLPLSISAVTLTVYAFHSFMSRDVLVRKYLLALVLLSFMIQFSLQVKGAYYSEFLYFIMMTALLLYQDRVLLVFFYGLTHLFYVSIIFMTSIGMFSDMQLSIFANLEALLNSGDLVLILLLTTSHLILCIVGAGYLKKRTLNDARNALYLEEQLNIESNLDLARQIANGKLDGEYTLHENDQMGIALLEMRQNLLDFRQKEERRNWMNEGYTQINDLLLSVEDLQELSAQLLKHICRFVGAQQGALYVVEKDPETGGQRLEMLSGLALSDTVQIQNIYEFGEGFVGEAAMRKKSLLIDEVPDGYRPIISGLGETKPRTILFTPLKVKDEVMGVLELSSIEPFQPHEIEFLEEVSDNIATSVLSAKASIQTRKLLEEAQIANEQLGAQEEEMRMNMEELQTTQEEMEKKQQLLQATVEESRVIFEAAIDAMIAFDEDGNIIKINPAGERIFGINSSMLSHTPVTQLLGNHHQRFLDKKGRSKLKRSNGEIFDAEVFISSYVNAQQENAFIAYVQDVSEAAHREKDIKELLDKSNQHLETLKKQERMIIENMENLALAQEEAELQMKTVRFEKEVYAKLVPMLDGAVYRAAYNQEFRILEISDYIASITGYQASDFTSGKHSYKSIIYADDLPHFTEVYESLPEEFSLRYRIVRRDKSFQWVHHTGLRIKTPTKKELYVGTIRSIYWIYQDEDAG